MIVLGPGGGRARGFAARSAEPAGSQMQPAGSCFACPSCGSTSGCSLGASLEGEPCPRTSCAASAGPSSSSAPHSVLCAAAVSPRKDVGRPKKKTSRRASDLDDYQSDLRELREQTQAAARDDAEAV